MLDCTVVVTASYIPTHPSCEIISDTINSLENLNLPPDTPIVIAHDYSPEPAYAEYLRNLAQLYAETPRVKIIVRDTFGHLTGSLRNALPHVKTKYMLVVQHDLLFREGCDLSKVIEDMEREPELKHIRFNKRSNIKTGWDARSDLFGKELCGLNYIYTRTPAWSDNNHVCTREYYRDIVMRDCRDGQPMEAGIYKSMFKSKYERYGTYIFGPLGHRRMLNQRDGRTEGKVVLVPTYSHVDIELKPKTIDLCLTGVLARSLAHTVDYIKAFIDMLSSAGHTVRVVVIANDPGSAPVDSTIVSHSDALALLKLKCPVHHVHTVLQSDLDKIVKDQTMRERLDWLICHRPGKACNAVHMPNMMRHILTERLCASYLEGSDCDVAFSLSPDIHFEFDHGKLLSILDQLDDNTLIVPDSRAPRKYQVNGFAGGARVLMKDFLQRSWIDEPDKRPVPQGDHTGWERTCFLTREQLGATQAMVKIDMLKVRANGDTKRAWACTGLPTAASR